LNRKAVEIAYLAHEIGSDLGDLDVEPERLEELRRELDEIEDVTGTIEDEFVDE